MNFKQAIGRRHRPDAMNRGRISNKETKAEYIEARRKDKRIVKQEKNNYELSIARIVNTIPTASTHKSMRDTFQ